MRNIKLTIEYDGKGFGGWQKQPNKLNIQGEIEQVINKITGEEIELNASRKNRWTEYMLFGQVANFKTNSSLEISRLKMAINSNLKKAIVVKDIEEVQESFHARYNCIRKTYRYVINNSKEGSAILRGLEYHIPQKLDVEKMKEAAKYFEGTHDFKGFKASGTSSKSSIRTIFSAKLEKQNDTIIIELTGNGFLYNMVRIISGTLVDVGLRQNSARKYKRNNRNER